MQPSLQTAAKFAATYRDSFGPAFEEYLTKGWTRPLNAAAVSLAEKAEKEMAAQAQEVVSLKQRAGEVEDRLTVVQKLTRLGLYWTVIVGLGVILWFAKGALRF